MHRVFGFKRESWLKHGTKKKKSKMILKNIFKVMNNGGFGKPMESVRSHRDIKLVIIEKWRNYLVSEPNYQTTILFIRKSFSNRNDKY